MQEEKTTTPGVPVQELSEGELIELWSTLNDTQNLIFNVMKRLIPNNEVLFSGKPRD